jgi:hypothetical protein
MVRRGVGPEASAAMASPRTVSARRTGDRWAVYYQGRLVVDGYERASEATWAVTFLARGERQAYVPEGAEVAWPWRGGDRAAGLG